MRVLLRMMCGFGQPLVSVGILTAKNNLTGTSSKGVSSKNDKGLSEMLSLYPFII